MSSALRVLLLAAATTGAAAFAPYAGPDLESFDFESKGLRIVGSKPRGRNAPAVVFLPYGIIPYADQIAFFLPAMTARDCDPPQLVQQPDRRILRTGRDRSLAGR